jgi:hypothetical protein
MNDPLLRRLERLPLAEPDAARAERTRARCQAALARRHPPSCAGAAGDPGRQPKPRSIIPRLWEPALAGLCLVYLTEVVRHALYLYRIP